MATTPTHTFRFFQLAGFQQSRKALFGTPVLGAFLSGGHWLSSAMAIITEPFLQS
jgi:hypothetical protein